MVQVHDLQKHGLGLFGLRIKSLQHEKNEGGPIGLRGDAAQQAIIFGAVFIDETADIKNGKTQDIILGKLQDH